MIVAEMRTYADITVRPHRPANVKVVGLMATVPRLHVIAVVAQTIG